MFIPRAVMEFKRPSIVEGLLPVSGNCMSLQNPSTLTLQSRSYTARTRPPRGSVTVR